MECFYESRMQAQIKKAISYTIDSRLHVDVDGCFVECQCECAEGMCLSVACKRVCCSACSPKVFLRVVI